MLIKNAEIDGRILDLRVGAQVLEIGTGLHAEEGVELDARGCAVLPGLHDHHIHLYASAVAANSVECAGLDSGQGRQLQQALMSVPGSDWVRGVGYHESVAGDLSGAELDALCSERPVRLQHVSGKLWILNSLAMQHLALADADHAGIERDSSGRPTGRLWRMDDWLQTRLSSSPPNLEALSRQLASYGITGVTDASYTNTAATQAQLKRAWQSGELLQRPYVMGDESVTGAPLKVMLDEDDLPGFDTLVRRIRSAHDLDRGVAFHCVSHVELVFVLAALAEAGYHANDRIEHGGVVRPECLPGLRASGACVVTQPGFVWTRGEHYRDQADARDLAHVYPYASLQRAGVSVAASSDSPYGPVDPWRVMASAVSRCTQQGFVFAETERVQPEEAMRGYLSQPGRPGGPARTIRVGVASDLCVLDRTFAEACEDLPAVKVDYTVISGCVVSEQR